MDEPPCCPVGELGLVMLALRNRRLCAPVGEQPLLPFVADGLVAAAQAYALRAYRKLAGFRCRGCPGGIGKHDLTRRFWLFLDMALTSVHAKSHFDCALGRFRCGLRRVAGALERS